MNEKIVGLLQELQEECKKAELPIVCGIVENATCNCSNCTVLKKALGIKQQENESSSDLDDLLQTFLRGELK